jgi:hypothetical protein|nr:MAG TPA: hypothetical protein [Caudoviricetes sp.]
MKFTKEQFSEALKAKLTNNGKKNLAMSERSFNEEVEDIYADLEESGNNEELELADAVGKKIKRLERIDNNVRNDNSKFVKEWEKNHPQKNDGDGNGDGNGDGGNKSELQKMQEQINSLLKREEENNKAKAVSEKRSQLKSALKGKDVKNEDWINDQLELIHIDSETDVDALTERLVKSYNKFNANTPPDITPGGTGGGKGKTDDFADVVAVVRKQSHREEK